MDTRLIQWLVWSAAYFVISLAIALIARGTDLDQLSSRSAISEAAAAVDRVLWGPHDWVGRQLGSDFARLRGATPALLLANTLAWGAALGLAWRLLVRRRTRTRNSVDVRRTPP